MNCTSSINPGTYGRRTDPFGEYVQKYLPVLADMPVEYIYEPWTAPLSVQQKAKCVIGKDYPERIVIHEVVSVRNANEMNRIKTELMETLQGVSYLLIEKKRIILFCDIHTHFFFFKYFSRRCLIISNHQTQQKQGHFWD